MGKIGKLWTKESIEKAIQTIKDWLDFLEISGMNLVIKYDAKQNIALIRFPYGGKNYEFVSKTQTNCRLNMWAIARVMEYKIRAHLMNIEPFQKSMQAYIQLDYQGTYQYQEQPNQQDTSAYGVLGISPLASNSEIEVHYKKMVRSWHPDAATTEEAKSVFEKKFTEINEAYQQIKKERGL